MKPASSCQKETLKVSKTFRVCLIAIISLMALLLASLGTIPVFSAKTPDGEIEPGQTINLLTATPQVVASVEPPRGTPTPPVVEQPGQAVWHPVGIGLAVLFVGLMITLFRWMFKVPPQPPYVAVKARQSVSALHCILVPTTEKVASERAVELACRLGETQKAEIILAYIVAVPFTLPLNAPMPAEQTKGQEALHTARFIVEQHGLSARTKIIPHRSVWGGILDLAKSERVDAIVMSVGAERPGWTDGMGRTTQEILKRAGCEVILDKVSNKRWR